MKKRLLTIILCGLITASFAACGDTGSAEKEEAPAETTTAAETNAADEKTADAPQIRGGNAETTKADHYHHNSRRKCRSAGRQQKVYRKSV